MSDLREPRESYDATGAAVNRRAIDLTRGAPVSMSATHVLELRRCVREKTYDVPFMIDAVARRILHSGDL